jgi:hypothetical protein
MQGANAQSALPIEGFPHRATVDGNGLQRVVPLQPFISKLERYRNQSLASSLGGLGKRLWLSCDHCQHSTMVDVRAFAERHGLDMRTPLLTISRALKCSRCGERRSWCRMETHGYGGLGPGGKASDGDR